MNKYFRFLVGLLLVLVTTRTALAQDGPITPQHTDPNWQVTYWNNTTLSGPPAAQFFVVESITAPAHPQERAGARSGPVSRSGVYPGPCRTRAGMCRAGAALHDRGPLVGSPPHFGKGSGASPPGPATVETSGGSAWLRGAKSAARAPCRGTT